ncbi:hypothetical protein AUF78_07795 [archaeon 13_1_20CM_2_51_12]|nr:MAG: hypothetical protein AUF78_07795 [archaeon 13_1_20CM_2_51_12]
MKDETSVTLADSILTKVWEIADSYYPKGDWAHGRSHIERVLRTALEIGNREGADLEIIEISAILHDIFASKEKHFGVEGFRHEIEASKEARNILKTLGLADKTVDAVCHCIESHRKRTGKIQPQTIEAKCLFDADKLDCVGAVGIVRSAFMALDHGQEFYKQEDIDDYERRNIRPDGTIIDYAQHSSNLEYELSLKEVAKRMYTETGRKLAKERSSFMDEFYSRLGKELKGIL